MNIEVNGKQITVEIEEVKLKPFDPEAFAKAEERGEVVELI